MKTSTSPSFQGGNLTLIKSNFRYIPNKFVIMNQPEVILITLMVQFLGSKKNVGRPSN